MEIEVVQRRSPLKKWTNDELMTEASHPIRLRGANKSAIRGLQ